jgi:predicted DNA-binding protein
MTVDVRYQSRDDKQFTVVSQSGSKFLFAHVLKGLLDGEKEAASAENQKRTDLNAENYNFALTGVEATPGGPQYVLSVTPKTDYKYLYRGKIWVDATDFAVTRIAAEPSKTPSFWVKRSEVNHKYEKVDDFWLPAENKTESWIRLGGHAQLSIEYNNYEITEPAASDEEGHARKVVARQN